MTLGVGMNLDLDLARTATLLKAVDHGTKSADLSAQLGFHKSMVASIKSWASHLGLFAGVNSVSCFGRQLLKLDPTFENPISRLLLYYQLGRNPKAEAFYYIVNNFLYDAAVSNRQFDGDELHEAAAQAGVGANSQANKQFDREMALMRRTLSRPQAFGPLGVLSSQGNSCFTVHPPILSPAFVAYAVYTEWKEDTAYTNFDEFEQLGRLARVCLLTRPALVNTLKVAARLGYLGVQEEARLNRVSRVPQWDVMKLLEAMYV